MTPRERVYEVIPASMDVSLWNNFTIQIVCTFMFALVYLQVGVDQGQLSVGVSQNTKLREIYLPCLAVALTYLGLLCSAG